MGRPILLLYKSSTSILRGTEGVSLMLADGELYYSIRIQLYVSTLWYSHCLFISSAFRWRNLSLVPTGVARLRPTELDGALDWAFFVTTYGVTVVFISTSCGRQNAA